MSDITKCSGVDCPLKSECYRFLAPADEYWQSFFTEVPYDKEEKSCKEFWNVKER